MLPRRDLLRWLVHSLELGTASVVACEVSPGPEPVEGAPALIPSKVYGETALLLRSARRVLAVHPDPSLRTACERSADTLGSALDEQRSAYLIACDPGVVVDWAFPHVMLGEADPRHREIAGRLLDLGAGPQRGNAPAPLDRLESQWLDRLLDRPGRSDSVDADGGTDRARWADSVLTNGADVVSGRLEGAYELTHAVLHASDQGRVDLPAELTAIVLPDCEALLGQALSVDNYDVAAELLWAWPMLGREFSPGAALAAEFLGGQHDAHGFLPGPGHAATRATDPDQVRRTSYHTAVAWGVLAASLLVAPEIGRNRIGCRPVEADPWPVLTHGQGAWWSSMDAAGAATRRAAAPVLLGAEIRLCVAGRDLGSLGPVLTWALDNGAEHLPSVQQAAELLSRLAAAARFPARPRVEVSGSSPWRFPGTAS